MIDFLKSLIDFIVGLFRPTPTEPPLTLPHPEEPINPSQTVANVNPMQTVQDWLYFWNVPEKYWDYWQFQIKFNVYDTWPPECLALGIQIDTPAYAIDVGSGRQLNILAKWCNAGTVAHENAHNSYALLTDAEKADFEKEYIPLITTDPLIKLLYSQNTYGLTSVVEGHAELFRYGCVPKSLEHFYPKLF